MAVTGDGDRWLRMVTPPAAGQAASSTVAGICSVSAELLAVDGAAIVLVGIDGQPVAIYASNSSFAQLEDLQFTLGVGPALDACARGSPVIEADLIDDPPLQWPGYADLAFGAGVQSVFSFPLQVGAARLGVLTFYRAAAGVLDGERCADALVMAAVVTKTMLDVQARTTEGNLAAGLAQGHIDLAEVHQATGMVSAQLHIGVIEAQARIRAHAFATGTNVHLVARAVISRSLVLSS
jgi:hypothetical protein